MLALVLVPLIVAAMVVCSAVWVLADARRWARQGTPEVLRCGSFTIETPEAWGAACLLLFMVFVPIYAVARWS